LTTSPSVLFAFTKRRKMKFQLTFDEHEQAVPSTRKPKSYAISRFNVTSDPDSVLDMTAVAPISTRFRLLSTIVAVSRCGEKWREAKVYGVLISLFSGLPACLPFPALFLRGRSRLG